MIAFIGACLWDRDAGLQPCDHSEVVGAAAGLIYLHLDPGYEPLRSDPRFAEIVQRVGVT